MPEWLSVYTTPNNGSLAALPGMEPGTVRADRAGKDTAGTGAAPAIQTRVDAW